ncbi:MAG: RIP metalloprotease RseP [Gemmatimonadaceae bacterium]
MLAYLAPILVFGLVIFVHELGHFLAAKATGVYAPRFSIGFGPAIFKFRRGETEYVLAWLPLGGFVRMASRHDQEAAFLEGGSEEATAKNDADPDYDPNAMIPFGPKPVPENRWFESKPLWARLLIMISGVVMNTLLAIVVGTGIAKSIGQRIVPSTVVGKAYPVAAAPGLARLQAGDSIIAVNGSPVATWNEAQKKILESTGRVDIKTQRGDVTVSLQAGATSEDIVNNLVAWVPAVLDSIVPGDPAEKAGLQRGDSVVSMNGAPIAQWMDLTERVSSSPGKPLTFVVSRRGAPMTFTVVPKSVDEPDSAGTTTHAVGKIGAAVKLPGTHQSLPLSTAFTLGVGMAKDNAGQVFRILHEIGSGSRSVKELGGPIAITRAAVSAGKAGAANVFYLILVLSMNVAVLNLLPIPILDGGQILINILETVKGSPFTMRTREYILRVGLAAIALLFVVVMYNDTRAWFVELFGWVGKLFGA